MLIIKPATKTRSAQTTIQGIESSQDEVVSYSQTTPSLRRRF